jgi:preprotein translocase subunit SecE
MIFERKVIWPKCHSTKKSSPKQEKIICPKSYLTENFHWKSSFERRKVIWPKNQRIIRFLQNQVIDRFFLFPNFTYFLVKQHSVIWSNSYVTVKRYSAKQQSTHWHSDWQTNCRLFEVTFYRKVIFESYSRESNLTEKSKDSKVIWPKNHHQKLFKKRLFDWKVIWLKAFSDKVHFTEPRWTENHFTKCQFDLRLIYNKDKKCHLTQKS